MEKVINVLYEIEEKANRILNRATEQKQKLYDQLNNDLLELENSITADTNNKINNMKSTMLSEIETEKEALTRDCKEQIQALEINYSSNHDSYVDKVFENIIKV